MFCVQVMKFRNYSLNISIDTYTKWDFNEQKSYQNPHTYSGYSSQEKSKHDNEPSVGHQGIHPDVVGFVVESLHVHNERISRGCNEIFKYQRWPGIAVTSQPHLQWS